MPAFLSKYSTFLENFEENRILNPCVFEKYSCCISTAGSNSIYNPDDIGLFTKSTVYINPDAHLFFQSV